MKGRLPEGYEWHYIETRPVTLYLVDRGRLVSGYIATAGRVDDRRTTSVFEVTEREAYNALIKSIST